MTYSFVNLSTTRFTLNGNTFYKTFLPFYIDSTHIRVYNIYDSRLSLLDVTHISDIEVDGTVFTNATELINAIHTVLFTKGGESGEEINNEQIELNRLAIIALQSSKADSTHTHDTRYYTKAQVDNLLSLIGSNQGIASGYVDGDKIRFYDSNGNQVLMVDADAFLAQGVSVLFEDGILYLKDSTGQTLSTTPVKANEAYYDTYVYDSGFETGLSDLDPEYPFMIVKTNSDAYYFINDADNTEVLDGSRIYLNEPELFFELGVPDITTEGFKAWLLDSTALDLVEDEEYRFNVWLTQGGIAVDTVLDAGSTNPVSNTVVTTTINDLQQSIASLTNSTIGSKIISGGIVWLSGLTWQVSNLTYYLNGVLLTASATEINLADADETYSRIDVIAVNDLGEINVIEGTPAANPAKPDIDTDSYLELTFILIGAGETEPEEISEIIIYNENLNIAGGEWDVSVTGSSSVINADNTTSTYSGTKDIYVQNPSTSEYIEFTPDIPIDITSVDTLSLFVRFLSGVKFTVYLFDGAISSSITITNDTYGVNQSNTSIYQSVAIPISDFGLTISEISKLRISFNSSFYGFIDYIRLLGGNNTTNQYNTFLSLTDTPESYAGNAGKLVTVKGNEQGVEFSDFRIKFQDNLGSEQFTASVLKFGNVRFDTTNKIVTPKTPQKTITTSVSLDNTYDGCIVKVKSNATLTIPTGLNSEFNCVFRTFTGVMATFAVSNGVTMDAPGGLVLAEKRMATLFKDGSSETFVLEGELTT